MHIFIKVGGKIKGRKIKLLKHVFALYSLLIIFSKTFLAGYARSITFILHLEMQACTVLYQPHLYFLKFFVAIISDCLLPKFTENSKNTHKIGYKMSTNFLRGWRGWWKNGGET